ncbi:MAG: DNA recombination protein RmuC [Bdellovibrio sp. CG10_big_fil_rev_8_21_14_0_10_47_8]|nr:MAG: DNA recombination protein RmuC [Bdellovibrio sp. CG10_big_fil_rev_8_21_14_0_10_47_8]
MEISVLSLIIGGVLGALMGAGGLFLFLRQQMFQLRESHFQKEQEVLDLRMQTTRLEAQKKDFEELHQQMTDRFELLASKLFEEKSHRMNDQNMKNLTTLLEPFKERLKDFEKKVEETYSTERAERGSLRGELSKLMELNIRMSSEAQNLTKALKGDNKVMGNWGEMILENILERSGLRKGEEYTVQGTDMGLKSESGRDLRPDVIINLPEGKHIIVDSKVSLKDYDAYIEAESPELKEQCAKAHVDSLKRHIDGLSEKKYHAAEGLLSPDFVILFMPIEPAFALAFKYRPDLLQMAWDQNIALVSPTTLLTTLRTVSAIWKQERQERNAMEIAKRGGMLYDKFASLVEDLDDLGGKIQGVQKSHSQVMNKLSEGSGNLIRQVEMLKELGAKAEKKLLTKPQ